MNYKSTLFLFIFCLVIVSPFIIYTKINKQQTSIKELTATTSASHLIVFGTLKNSFTAEMIEILHNGIPLRFSFFVELYETKENWADKRIATYDFQHIMIFDTLKENYRVTLEESNNKILSFGTLPMAQKVINEINGAKIVKLEQLSPGKRYQLRIKAELHRKILPLDLHLILPFLSWWNRETVWHPIEFRYLQKPVE